ncbi:MAG: PQQ-binding-like beta-propeller repeat protein [Gemmatimonadaceae bacterium]|nr:PQQ-binding-like beta-propeller repeat protein [Gemmatimonadaceae bacterium]
MARGGNPRPRPAGSLSARGSPYWRILRSLSSPVARPTDSIPNPVRRLRVLCTLVIPLVVAGGCTRSETSDWLATGADRGNTHYSPLSEIDRDNVAGLRVAWTYRTGDLPAGGGQIQATPIIVGGILYTTTPGLAVVALRADSGTLLWRFQPPASRSRGPSWSQVNRGVVYWARGDDARILYTAGRFLYALDARTGRSVRTFGDSGAVDLARGLSRDIGDAFLVATSPGVIHADLLIQGTRVGEGEGSAPGDVRAYDVRTGAIRWTFHTIPHPGEFGHDTWPPDAWKTAGGANAWAGMAVDTKRGIVYVPTGSATPDFYGGARVGADLFANSLLALDAATGRRLWHFQAVHHDLWDRDLPAAPTLARLNSRDVVVQITKPGNVFIFDRGTGASFFPIEERRVPPSDLEGEQAWPTQPSPTKPAPFARQSISDRDVAALSPAERARFRTLRSSSLWQPPSREGSIMLPGFDGGGEWGGAAVDPSGTLYVNASDVPWIARMRAAAPLPAPGALPRAGARVYAESCAGCHGADRRGRDRAPSLVATRLTPEAVAQVLASGKGFMPSFAALPRAERDAVIAYLLGRPAPADARAGRKPEAREAGAAPARPPWEFVGYERWRDSGGYPAIAPPWGTLSAVNLETGEYRWRIPLGDHPGRSARGAPVTGTEQYGGPIVTAGGLVFIAATEDAMLRALDSRTGKVLWAAKLPAPGFATPATYAVRGKQYVVIAAGGGKLGAPSSDTYVAFTLP